MRFLFLGTTRSGGDTLVFVEGTGSCTPGDVVLKKRFPSFQSLSKSRARLDVLDRVQARQARVDVPSHGDIGDASTVDLQTRAR